MESELTTNNLNNNHSSNPLDKPDRDRTKINRFTILLVTKKFQFNTTNRANKKITAA